MNTLVCQKNRRREKVREKHNLYGLDFVEVGDDRRVLTVFFLGKADYNPNTDDRLSLTPENIIIEGGRRIRDIRVEKVEVTQIEMPELDDFMTVTLNKAGDFSTYTLKVVERDDSDETPTNWKPHSQFDVHYNRVEFSFDTGECASDLDCRQAPVCPPERRDEPDINYLAKDYASFRQLMYDRLALILPDWKERHAPDLGVTLVELLAYVGDHLSYYQDAVATEAYLDTARQRISVRRHVRLVDYPMHEGCNARAWVCLKTNSPFRLPAGAYFITRLEHIPPTIREEDLQEQVSGGYEIFEPLSTGEEPGCIYPEFNELRFYSWSDQACCLPKGATSATLIGGFAEDDGNDNGKPVSVDCPQQSTREAHDPAAGRHDQKARSSSHPPGCPPARLRPGDILMFVEAVGPETGNPADADPKHRHAVRLTAVRGVTDPLDPDPDNPQPLTEIEWSEEDALPFPLCLSAQRQEPPCDIIENISVACGNVVLVDHGVSVSEPLPPVPAEKTLRPCDCLEGEAEAIDIPGRFEPALEKAPLVFRQPLSAELPASKRLRQDVRKTLPQIELWEQARDGEDAAKTLTQWQPRRDLLGSGERDRHFVVETDDEGRGHLRFGNDELGKRPAAGAKFVARYRVGGGPAGNVGAGGIGHLVTRTEHISVNSLSVSNPLPAVGGENPEPLSEVKLFAPHAMRKRLERAITPQDYADIVLREFPHKVQRAAARLVWNGSWHELLLAVDPLGKEMADESLLAEITARLHRYRRMGHDLVVQSARQVPLHIKMNICVLPGFLRGHVKSALLDVFSNRRLPDGRLGAFHPDKLTFGEGVYLSHLVATAQSVEGVANATVVILKRLNEPSNGELEKGVLPMGPFEIARLDNDPSLPETGKLELRMEGGR